MLFYIPKNMYILYSFNTFEAFFGQPYVSLSHNVYNYIKKNNLFEK